MTTPWPWSIFEHRDPNTTAYAFYKPSVAISGEDLPLDFDRERKQWHIVQEEDGSRWEVWGGTQVQAILALIAMRADNSRVTFERIPEDDDEEEGQEREQS